MHKFQALILAIALVSCKGPVERITISNETAADRTDEQFVVKRSDLRIGKSELLPVLSLNGTPLPSQTDDMDGNGIWDELAFEVSVPAGSSVSLGVKWVPAAEVPQFEPRTNIRYGKLSEPGKLVEMAYDSHDKYEISQRKGPYPYQMDGPGWENDRIAMRIYIDGRNSRDITAKKTERMVLDTVGIGPNGNPLYTYKNMRDWGYDILAVSGSFGPGGIALERDGRLIRLGLENKDSLDVIEKTEFRHICEGPVRSAFRMTYTDWNIGGEDRTDLSELITIWAGRNGYEEEITIGKIPEGCNIVTGIVNSKLTTDPIEEKMEGMTAMYTFDRQSVDGQFLLGMGLLIPTDEFQGTSYAPNFRPGIRDTWVARLKPSADGKYRYNVYNGWEHGVEPFTDAASFGKMLGKEAVRMTRPLKIVLE
ncbi:MAG: DUF4861 domain-containing protein [Bacteroidales bacterium]|nr:DUF4861 domain-containing protein [Bacteroidales bacterium]